MREGFGGWKLAVILIAASIQCLTASISYDEKLTLYSLNNDANAKSLQVFQVFQFQYSSMQSGRKDGQIFQKFPIELSKLIELTNTDSFELTFAQGRWRERIVESYYKSSKELEFDFTLYKPGATFISSTMNETSLVRSLSVLFGVSLERALEHSVQIFDEVSAEKVRYSSLPYEYYCKENLVTVLKFIRKIEPEGLVNLISLDEIARSDYGFMSFKVRKQQGGYSVTNTIAYKSKVSPSEKEYSLLSKYSNSHDDETSICPVCSSKIFVNSGYEARSIQHSSNTVLYLQEQQSALSDKLIQSTRYLTGASFDRHIKFVHVIENLMDENVLVTVTDNLPFFFKTFINTLHITLTNTRTKKVVELTKSEIHKYLQVKYTENHDVLVTLARARIGGFEKMTITLDLEKKLLHFEDYPNDPDRGFDIPHMPVYYSVEAKSPQWKLTFSNSLLVLLPEPDFSMPFNVNAVTCIVMGFLFINMLRLLVKPKRFFIQ